MDTLIQPSVSTTDTLKVFEHTSYQDVTNPLLLSTSALTVCFSATPFLQ